MANNGLLSSQEFAKVALTLLKERLILGQLLIPPRSALCEVVAEGLGIDIETLPGQERNTRLLAYDLGDGDRVHFDVLYGTSSVKLREGK